MNSENKNSSIEPVKRQILDALAHEEGQEGLYFRNFGHLHEEDERAAVEANDEVILDALEELMREGKVRMEEGGDEAIFYRR